MNAFKMKVSMKSSNRKKSESFILLKIPKMLQEQICTLETLYLDAYSSVIHFPLYKLLCKCKNLFFGFKMLSFCMLHNDHYSKKIGETSGLAEQEYIQRKGGQCTLCMCVCVCMCIIVQYRERISSEIISLFYLTDSTRL